VLQDLSQAGPLSFWTEVYRQVYRFLVYEEDYTIRHLRWGSFLPGQTRHPG